MVWVITESTVVLMPLAAALLPAFRVVVAGNIDINIHAQLFMRCCYPSQDFTDPSKLRRSEHQEAGALGRKRMQIDVYIVPGRPMVAGHRKPGRLQMQMQTMYGITKSAIEMTLYAV